MSDIKKVSDSARSLVGLFTDVLLFDVGSEQPNVVFRHYDEPRS